MIVYYSCAIRDAINAKVALPAPAYCTTIIYIQIFYIFLIYITSFFNYQRNDYTKLFIDYFSNYQRNDYTNYL